MGKDEPNVFCFIDVTHKHTKCLLDKIISKQEKEAKKKSQTFWFEAEWIFIYM